MREGWPSLTAMFVAWGRGVGAPAPVDDPFAQHLLPPAVGQVTRLCHQLARSKAGLDVLRTVSVGLLDHVTLRTCAIDARLKDFMVRQPSGQVVILGAGLDARAWRMNELSQTTVFEVDHPDTQRFKLSRLDQRPSPNAHVVHVAVDFERQSFPDLLQKAGFDPERPTFWIWEGVTEYLTPEAIRDSLGSMARLSAKESEMAVTYARPTLSNLAPGLRQGTYRAFSWLGEPLRGVMTTEALQRLLERHDFERFEDSGTQQWAQNFLPPDDAPRIELHERLMVARKRG